jgi:hypothetical protein
MKWTHTDPDAERIPAVEAHVDRVSDSLRQLLGQVPDGPVGVSGGGMMPAMSTCRPNRITCTGRASGSAANWSRAWFQGVVRRTPGR